MTQDEFNVAELEGGDGQSKAQAALIRIAVALEKIVELIEETRDGK